MNYNEESEVLNPETADPVVLEPKKGEDVVTIEDDSDKSVIVKSDSNDDNKLPKTATSTFNWLFGGFIVLFAGVAGLFTHKEKSRTK